MTLHVSFVVPPIGSHGVPLRNLTGDLGTVSSILRLYLLRIPEYNNYFDNIISV